jgi:hypothetical protein
MNKEIFFKEMFFNIWQGNDLKSFDKFYAKDFQEIVHVSDENQKPIELKMTYDQLIDQATWYQENYSAVTLTIHTFVVAENNHFCVNFYSSSIYNKTGELHHRYVSGIWRLNPENKIDKVCAVVTPYYSLK